MIWLPDDCLWLNGINEAPSAWTGPTGESLRDNRVFQDSHWYNLTKILDIDPELSSFSVFLRPSVGLVPLLDLEDKSTLYSIDSYVRIADVESKRAKQNVNSNLTLNAKESPFELFKVPDDQRPSGSLP